MENHIAEETETAIGLDSDHDLTDAYFTLEELTRSSRSLSMLVAFEEM